MSGAQNDHLQAMTGALRKIGWWLNWKESRVAGFVITLIRSGSEDRQQRVFGRPDVAIAWVDGFMFGLGCKQPGR